MPIIKNRLIFAFELLCLSLLTIIVGTYFEKTLTDFWDAALVFSNNKVNILLILLFYSISAIGGWFYKNYRKFQIEVVDVYLPLLFIFIILSKVNSVYIFSPDGFGPFRFISSILIFWFFGLRGSFLDYSSEKNFFTYLSKCFRNKKSKTPISPVTNNDKSEESDNQVESFIIPDLDIEAEAKLLHPGIPLQNAIELIDKDGLRLASFAKQIIKAIQGIKPESKAFSVGIDGEWGSGKSSLIAMIKHNMQNELSFQNKLDKSTEVYKINRIDFVPWMYPDEQSLIANFFEEWRKVFLRDLTIQNTLSEYSKIIANTEKGLIKTELMQLLLPQQNSLKTLNDKIREKIKQRKELYYFFIDDLDRVGKKEIVEIIRLCRILADFPNTIYFLAYDRKYIDNAIDELVEIPDKRAEFFNKVVQVEFKMPMINDKLFSDFLFKTVSEQLRIMGFWNKITIQKTLRELCDKNYLKFFLKNIRDIKRFSNTFLIRYSLNHNKVDFYTFFLFELFHYKYKESYVELYNNIENWNRRCFKNKNVNIDDDQSINNYFGIKIVTEEIHHILSDIYCNTATENQIRNNIYPYFALSGLEGYISKSEFDAWITDDNGKVNPNQLIDWINSNSINSFKDHFLTYILEKKPFLNDLDDSTIPKVIKVANQIRAITVCLLNNKSIYKDDYEFCSNIIFEFISEIYKDNDNIISNRSRFTDYFFEEFLIDNFNDNFLSQLKYKLVSLPHRVIVSDSNTIYIGSSHKDLKRPPYNQRQKAYSGKITDYLEQQKMPELIDVNWITREIPLTIVECDDNNATFIFERTFYSFISHENADSVLLYIQADDSCEVYLNDEQCGMRHGFLYKSRSEILEPIDLKEKLRFGKNVLKLNVTNMKISDHKLSPEKLNEIKRNKKQNEANPYGVIFKLIITPIPPEPEAKH